MALGWFALTGIQAIAWTPTSPSWLRACIAMPVYMGLIGCILLMAIFGIPEPYVFCTLSGLSIVAYALALHGVAMGRRGDVYDWRAWQRFMNWLATGRK